MRRMLRSHWRGVAAIILIGVAGAGVVGLRLTDPEPRAAAMRDRQLLLLNDLSRLGRRPTAGRLSWTDAHLPYTARRSTAAAGSLSPDARIAAAEIEKGAIHGDGVALARLGVAKLVQGAAAEAVPLLERARGASPANAAILSDLSAAYLERSAPADTVKALDAAAAALRLDGEGPAARFNLAFASERALPAAAADNWRKFLSLERDGHWRAEAEERLRRLETLKPVSWFDVSEEILPKWATACLSGDHGEEVKWRQAARDTATALTRSGTDRYPSAVVATLSRGPVCDRGTADAWKLFERAREAYRQDDFPRAAVTFDRADRRFARISSPLALEARMYAAIAGYFDERRRLTTVPRLRTLLTTTERSQYLRIAAKTYWMLGYVAQEANRFHEAVAAYTVTSATIKARS